MRLTEFGWIDALFSAVAKPFEIISQQDLLGRIIGFSFFTFWVVDRFMRGNGNASGLLLANWWLVNVQFSVFIASYVIRKKAVTKAQGFWETIYPLGCAMMPFALEPSFARESPVTQHGIHGYVFAMLVTGVSIQVLGVWSLRRAFSIMTESREVVARGIYKLMRHPMYVGSIVSCAGLAWWRFSTLNAFIFTTYVFCQWWRSRREEAKLSSTFPEYVSYKKRVWWF